eukprot:COSAG05_NODE_1042_length_6066_cov_2.922742_2_plen_1109_part_00
MPVMMQDNWRATEWLGLLTAGSLWTPLHDASTMQENLPRLVEQIKAAVPTIAATVSANATKSDSKAAAMISSGESDELQALRSELDSLRGDLAKKATQRDAVDDEALSVLAPIPAEVPALSLNCRPTADMEKLKRMLISTDSDGSTMAVTATKSKIGALGMGGIGKTVTATWLARDEDVRRHFELVVWVTLGQTPDLARMQALIHLQATGEELSPDATPEQAKELITVAMRGRQLLLVLDDVWDEEYCSALDLIDTSTASKTLVTTRIRGLGGAAQVELGMPSQDDAVKLLLASAGLEHLSPPPAEAAEVVQTCGCLPLAVDLAGKMLRDFGVSGADWTGIPALLRQEMRAGDGDDSTVEYRVISASLSTIPPRDRANAKQVLSTFALIAEDTYVPISAFRILFSVVSGEEELVPEMQLRKWLQLLINRSLVLGSWERPSLHDIVREYTISLFSSEELRVLQQKVVDAFVAHRPASFDPTMCGLRLWSSTHQKNNDCQGYVLREIEHHIRGAIDLGCDTMPPYVAAWMQSYPGYNMYAHSDDIVVALANVLGVDRLYKMIDEAIHVEHEWLTQMLVQAWMGQLNRQHGKSAFNEMIAGKWAHLWGPAGVGPHWVRLALRSQPPTGVSETAFEHWALGKIRGTFAWVNYLGDSYYTTFSNTTRDDINSCTERVVYLLDNTAVGRASGHASAPMKLILEVQRLRDAGDFAALDPLLLPPWHEQLEALLDNDEVDHKKILAILRGPADVGASEGGPFVYLRLKEWRWDLFDRVNFVAALESYDVEADFAARFSELWDLRPFYNYPLFAALRGDIGQFLRAFSIQLHITNRLIEVYNNPHTADELKKDLELWVQLSIRDHSRNLHMMGRKAEAVGLFVKSNLTWSTADAFFDEMSLRSRFVRGRGQPTTSMTNLTAEALAWQIKLQFVLCTSCKDVAPEDVLEALPSPDVLESYVVNVSPVKGRQMGLRNGVFNLLLLAAEVCEMLERPAEALTYLAKALRVDESDPTTDMRPTTHAQGHALRGRMLAAQGKKAEAEAAFEEAVEVSHRTGLRLLEMFALRDLKKHILDADGRGEQGIQRLKVLLAAMKGPAAELTKLLGEGRELDAEAILL